MRKFILKFEPSGTDAAKSVEFLGEDPHEAFTILALEREQQCASLWDGERRLAVIRRTGEGSWQIG